MLKLTVIAIIFTLINACSQQTPLLDSVDLDLNQSSYFTVPQQGTGPFPAVVLMHGCGGLSVEVMNALENHAKFLQKNGYATLIVDSFSTREALGKEVCRSYDKLAKARDYRQRDAYQALAFLQSQSNIDKHNIFLMGQSNGGSVALKLADKKQYVDFPLSLPSTPSSNFAFTAIVAFYPWCGVRPEQLDTPLLILGGEKDDWTPIAPCFNKTQNTMMRPFNVIEYENAHHSFDLFIPEQTYQGHTVGGNKTAQQASQIEMLAWFEKFKKISPKLEKNE